MGGKGGEGGGKLFRLEKGGRGIILFFCCCVVFFVLFEILTIKITYEVGLVCTQNIAKEEMVRGELETVARWTGHNQHFKVITSTLTGQFYRST